MQGSSIGFDLSRVAAASDSKCNHDSPLQSCSVMLCCCWWWWPWSAFIMVLHPFPRPFAIDLSTWARHLIVLLQLQLLDILSGASLVHTAFSNDLITFLRRNFFQVNWSYKVLLAVSRLLSPATHGVSPSNALLGEPLSCPEFGRWGIRFPGWIP